MSDGRLPSFPRRAAFALVHVLASRVAYVSAFVFGELLKAGNFANGVHPLPDLRQAIVLTVRSTFQYSDFLWYRMVAVSGYDPTRPAPGEQRDWAFFPLFPLLMHMAWDARLWFAVSMATFAVSAVLMGEFSRRLANDGVARAAVMLLCYFPYSFTVSQFRPETFMLALSLAAAVLALSERPLLAAIPGALVGFAKPDAFLLALALPQDRRAGSRWAWLAAVAAPFAGVAFMCAFMFRLVGDPLAWARIQGTWGAGFLQTPFGQARDWLAHPMIVGRMGWDPMLIHYMMLAGVLVVAAQLLWARKPWLAAYLLFYVGLTFANFGVFVLGKHLSACFAFFFGAALVVARSESARIALCALGCGLLALNGLYGGADLLFVLS